MLNKKCIVFDLDGTIYFGDSLAKKAKEVLEFCNEKFEYVFFITNNSAKTRKEIYEKLSKMGLEFNYEQLITCSHTIGKYLNKKNLKEVLVIGTKSLRVELSTCGINVNSEKPQAIIVGYNRDFCLEDLKPIIKFKDSDCKLIIANKEHSYPWNDGEILPGAAPIVGAVESTLNKPFDICVGKPNPLMLEIMLEGLNVEPKEVLVVGDSYASDIKMAQDFGAEGILISKDRKPDCTCISELWELLEIIK